MDTLVVVDMQNDFITGPLGSPEAKALLPKVTEFTKGFDGYVCYTVDEHFPQDTDTVELKAFGEHCMVYSDGWKVPQELKTVLEEKGATCIPKDTFMPRTFYTKDNLTMDIWKEYRKHKQQLEGNTIYVCGLCTDICVLNVALNLRNELKYYRIVVLEDLCAGTSPENHQKALDIMKMNCIEVKISEELK